MELREFVAQALLDIVGGVRDAQMNPDMPALIAPNIKGHKDLFVAGLSRMQAIDFEIKVLADKKSGSKAKLNVVAAVIGGNVQGQSGKSEETSATLKFKVPLEFPLPVRLIDGENTTGS